MPLARFACQFARTAGGRLAAVHRVRARTRHRPVQGRHRRLVSRAERPPVEKLGEWLSQIENELGEYKALHPEKKVAPYAVNQICHASNDRLMKDMETCVKHKVPIIITSLRPPIEIVEAAHSYGGVVFHDVINVKHARKAAEQGVDGLILVCAGAGGHAGTLSPFALLREVKQWFKGTILLSGAISDGWSIASALALGADLAYMGTRFIATAEGQRRSGLQGSADRARRARHRLFEPVHRRARQLSRPVDRGRGPRSRQSAAQPTSRR